MSQEIMLHPIERHPWQPFIPQGCKVIMLGTFPPKPARWSMPFFYPNKSNDMWRVMGIIFHDDKQTFYQPGGKAFDQAKIERFLQQWRIGVFDTALAVRRLKDNASDKFLEIVETIDLQQLIGEHQSIQAVVTTGEKAASVIAQITGTEVPKMGEYVMLQLGDRALRHYRMPSTSRAFPMAPEVKATYYRGMLQSLGYELD